MSNASPLPAAYRLVAHERIGSTNEEAKRLAEAGADDLTLVWAREQTAGRGRRGRGWVSPPGNLYLSLILRPDCEAIAAAQLGMVAAVAMGEAVDAVMTSSEGLQFKWPNDILLDGAKIAGILLESAAGGRGRLAWLVLGIGVNIASHPSDTEFPATSLQAGAASTTGGQAVSVEILLESFADAFLKWRDLWRAAGFGPVREAWLARAWKRGETIRARLEGQTLEGIFADLDEQGVLLLDLPEGTQRRITAADVFAIPVSV